MPQRGEEIFTELVKAIGHSNAWGRVAAVECVSAFPEQLSLTKSLLLQSLKDEDELVREVALGQLVLVVQQPRVREVMPPAEISDAARAVIDAPVASARLKELAKTVLRLAAEQVGK